MLHPRLNFTYFPTNTWKLPENKVQRPSVCAYVLPAEVRHAGAVEMHGHAVFLLEPLVTRPARLTSPPTRSAAGRWPRCRALRPDTHAHSRAAGSPPPRCSRPQPTAGCGRPSPPKSLWEPATRVVPGPLRAPRTGLAPQPFSILTTWVFGGAGAHVESSVSW